MMADSKMLSQYHPVESATTDKIFESGHGLNGLLIRCTAMILKVITCYHRFRNFNACPVAIRKLHLDRDALTQTPSHTEIVTIQSCLTRTPACSITSQHALDKLSERPKPLGFLAPLLIRQIELLDEQHKVLEASVEMRLQSESTHNTVVMAVDVGVDTVQPLEKHLDGLLEAFWEWHTWLSWEDTWVAKVVRGP